MELLIGILDIRGFLGKNLANIPTKKSKKLQDLAKSCQETQEIPRLQSRVSRKTKNMQENARGFNIQAYAVYQ